MQLKMPKDLNTLSKEELIELVRELIAKMDNLVSENARTKETKPKCSPCKSRCCK